MWQVVGNKVVNQPSLAHYQRILRRDRMGVKCAICGRTKKPIGRDSRDNGLCEYECEGYLQEPYPSAHWDSELKDEFIRGFNAAIDKAVEVVESANNFLDALNQDEVWNISCRQADRKLRAVIEELNKLKENI
jgi:recombinational DNA repair protein (RecF pathway)